MNFIDSLLNIVNIYEEEDISKQSVVKFKRSEAFKYIFLSINNIIGSHTNDNIFLEPIHFHDKTPMFANRNDNEFSPTKIVSHAIFLPENDREDIFMWFWHLSHEMTHAFLSLKDNKLISSYDEATLFEEGLATFIAKELYYSYFKKINISHPIIYNNDAAYDYAENIYRKIAKKNNFYFVKKIRSINPSLKKLQKEDFKYISISYPDMDIALLNFQRNFNRVPGTY